MSAALEAVAQGAQSVIVLEKTSRTGRLLNFTSGSMSAAETTIQKENGIEDSKEQFFQDVLTNGSKFDGKVDEAMIRVFVEEAPATYKAAAHEVMDTLLRAEPKIQVVYNTTAIELVPNAEGQVLSVIGTHDGGGATRYDAKNGIIVATGGYSANKTLMSNYAEYGKYYLAGGPSTADGSGLLMMQKVGAALNETSMGTIPIFPMGLESATMPGTGTIASTYTWKAGGITVNKNGERFMNEQDSNNAVRTAWAPLQPPATP